MLNAPQVRAAGAKAFTGFVLILDNNEQRAPFVGLTAAVIEAVVQACQSDELKAQSTLESLIELAERLPKFFRPSMPILIDRMMAIAKTAELEDGTRRLAIEVLTVIAEEASSDRICTVICGRCHCQTPNGPDDKMA